MSETRMLARKRKKRKAGPGRLLLPPRGDAWDEQQVAEHLMSCRAQMVCGLRRKTPWAGLDADTLDSCFGHGAALIVRLAASGERPAWRSAADLEKAQVAAFRHQAFDHWKRVNAQSRRGDRFAVAFDPERHAAPDSPIERLFEEPDLHVMRRDLLAEFSDLDARAFWDIVLGEGATFKAAGDRLGLTKAQVMARTRAGRALLLSYLGRRQTGELCRERGGDIAAHRAGTADDAGVERAVAHLDSCYECSLIHQPQRGAFERGILGVAPIGWLLRVATWAGDAASAPAARWADAGPGARVAAGGLAALALAGSGVGLRAAIEDQAPAATPKPAAASPQPARRTQTSSPRDTPRAAALLVPRTPTTSTAAGTRTGGRAAPRKRTHRRTTRSASVAAAASPSPAIPSPPGPEFSFESPSRAAAPAIPEAPPAPAPPAASPAAEFAGP